MRRLVSLILCIAIFVARSAAKEFIVVDAFDSGPIVGATVFGRSGVIKGLTNETGCISIGENEIPATIRCVGYEPFIAMLSDDTIRMAPSAYQLNEVVVTPADRPIKRVLCFAREYSTGITGSDTMQYYCEYMAEAFVVDGKVRGYKRSDSRPAAKNHRRYARIVREGRDSIFIPTRQDDITELSWFDFMAFIPEKEDAPEAILNGFEADTLSGKYGPKFIYGRKNGYYTVTADILSDHKNHKWSPFIFKLIGFTVDIEAGSWTMTFADRGAPSYSIHDFVCGTYNLHIVGRGKWLKKIFNTQQPIEMDTYLELFPVEITNCTVEEYREKRDDYTPVEFQYPSNILPLSPAVESLVNSSTGSPHTEN